MDKKLHIMVMSGVEDGTLHEFSTNDDGIVKDERWTLVIGRKEESDLCLRNDTFISRSHAKLHWKGHRWWLEDQSSTNGSFVGNPDDYFEDNRVKGIIPIEVDQLFRIGRTWLRIQPSE